MSGHSKGWVGGKKINLLSGQSNSKPRWCVMELCCCNQGLGGLVLQLFHQLGTIRVSQFSQLLCRYFLQRHMTGGLGTPLSA